jgi:hypothetical protein
MIQTTTPYNLQWVNYGKFFFKSQAFFKRALCSLDYMPAYPAYRQAGAGRYYEIMTQINFNLEEWIYPVRNNAPLEFLTGFTE